MKLTPTGEYDSEANRPLLRWLGIEPHIAKRRTAYGSGLGKVRWEVDRSFFWMTRFRRLVQGYERLSETLAGLHYVAICLLMLRKATSQFCLNS